MKNETSPDIPNSRSRFRAVAMFLLALAGRDGHAACPAEVVMPAEQELAAADAVVVGRAIGKRYSAAGPGGKWADGTYYTVVVSSVQHGSAARKIALFSENSSGRFPMALNRPYLLFVSSCEGVRYVDAKGNSGSLPERLDVLGQVVSHRRPPGP
jgi:hypothetical protein